MKRHPFLTSRLPKSSARVANGSRVVEPLESRIAPASVLTGTLADSIVDADGDGKAELGELITYLGTIDHSVISDTAALNLQIQAILDANTTLVPGSLNVSPLPADDGFVAIGNTLLRVGGSAGSGIEKFISGGSLTANDRDFFGDTFTAVAVSNGTSTQGGTFTIATDGTFTYLSAPGFNGTDTFTYTVRDDGPDNIAGNSDDLTNTAVVTITVNSTVWYVDSSYADGNGASDGTSLRPFKNLTPLHTGGTADSLDDPGDTIYVQKGAATTAGNLLLENNQRLIGAATTLVVDGTTLATGVAGNKPTLSGQFTLGSNNQLRGLDIASTGAGTALSGTNFGTLIVRDVALSASNGAALVLNTGTADIGFNSISSTNATTGGVILTAVGGTFLVTGGTTITNAGSIAQPSLQIVNSGGTFSFGAVDINSRNGTGIFLDNNDGGFLRFGGTVNIPNPDSSGGYGVRLEDSTSPTYFTTLNISNTTQTIDAADADGNDIPDNDGDGDAVFVTNNPGGLTIAAGTLSGLAADGIDFRNSANLTVTNVTINDLAKGAQVTTSAEDAGINVLNLTGNLIVLDSTISRFHGPTENLQDNGVRIQQFSTSFSEIRVDNLTVFNDEQTDADSDEDPRGSHGFYFVSYGTVNGTINIANSTFRDLTGEGVFINAGNDAGSGAGGGALNIAVTNTQFLDSIDAGASVPTFGGLQIVTAGFISAGNISSVSLDVRIEGNTFNDLYTQNANTHAVVVLPRSTGNFKAVIDGNSMTGSPGRGAFRVATGDLEGEALSSFDLTFSNNTANDVRLDGLLLDIRGDSLTNGTVGNVRILNNNFGSSARVGDSGVEGMWLRVRDGVGANATQAKTVNMLVSGNIVRNLDNSVGDEAIDVDALNNSTVNLTMIGNTADTTGNATNEIDMSTNGTSTINVDFRNNTSLQNGAPSGATAVFNTAGGGTINLESGSNTGNTPNATGTVGSIANVTMPTGVLVANDGFVQDTNLNAGFGTSLQVLVRNPDGSPAAGVTVTFTAPGSGASGSFTGGTTAITDANGLATKVFTANGTAGRYTVSATAAGFNTTQFYLLNNAGAPTAPTLGTVSEPGSAGGATSQPAVTVGVVDATTFTLSSLPLNKDLTIRYGATVNNNITASQVSGRISVSGSNITTVLSDDPGTGAANDATITLVDLPDVSVASNTVSLAEDSAGNIIYTFTRTGPNDFARTVNFSITGTASATSDYTVTNGSGTFTPGTGLGTITFAAGSSTATITLTPTADTTVENNETTIVNVTAGTGYEVGTPANATTTINNDDTDVSVTVAPASVTEDGAGNLVYTFTRAGVTSNSLTANFSLSGSAANSGDYSVSFAPGTGTYTAGTGVGTVVFAPGVTTVTVTVDPTTDNTVEGDETVLANVTAGTGYNIAGTQASGTITNDDSDVTLSVAPASVTEDGAGNLVYTFTRNGFITNALTVNFTVGGGATFGSDYGQTGAASFGATTGTVTFAAGSTTATVTIDPNTDTLVEGDETVTLTLGSGTGYNVATAGAVSGTITNDDTDVSVSVAPASVTEDGAGNLVYTFTRNGFITNALTVNFSVGGTATFGSDYGQTGAATFTTTTGTVTFAAGSTTATVTIDPTTDTTAEGDETTVLTLTSGTGYNTTGAPATATILNDDTNVSLAVAPASVTEDGAGNLVYTFTRTGIISGSTTVNFNVGGTATFNTDYSQSGATTFASSTGTITFAPGETVKTITVDPTADSTVETDETVTLTLTTGTGYTSATPGSVSGTISNDDASVSVAVAPASVAEDGAGNLVYTFTRTGFTTNSLTVNFSVGGTATFNTDYGQSGAATFTTTTGTVTFAPGATTATVTVDPTADASGEPDETVDLTITSGSGYSIGTASASGTILNDDTAVSVAVSPGTSSESTLTPLVYTFTRTGDTSTALTVNFGVGGTAALTNDYTASGAATFNSSNGTVVIPIGQSSVIVTLTPVNDTTPEASETAILTVAAGSGYSASGSPATGTILDNDIDLQITKTDGTATEIPGTTATYTIIVTNAGLSAVSGASIADTFAAILTNVSYTAVTSGGATGFTASGSGNINDTAVNLPAGATITYTVTGTILASATGTLVNTATVGAPAGITDPNLANNSATDTDTLVPQGDLSITKTDSKVTLVPGTQNTYTIVVTNNGPSNVVGATVADTFPAVFSGVTYTASGTAGTTFTATGSGNLNDTVNIPSGGSITYTVTGTVLATATGTLSNTATVSAPASFTETTPGNNSATDSDTLTPQGDLSITKTDSKTTLVPGTLNTYTIVVTNSGPSTAVGATLADNFPVGFAGVTFTAVGAGGASGFTTNGSGNLNETLTLPSGASVTYTVTGTVSSAVTGSFANTATISAPGGFTDTNSENNSATDTDTLTPQVDLSITKTDSKTTAVPGTSNTYVIVVSNSGPSDAVGASLADIFPGNFTGVTYSAVGTGGASGFSANGSGSLDQLVNLPSGATITYTVTGTILASATGTLTNTATITAAGGTTDTNPGNNSATDSDTLTPQADLSITKTNGVSSLVPGTQTTYTITVSNSGPSNTSATVADIFPAGLSNITFTASGAGGAAGFTNGSGNLNQSVTIPAGGSITYTVTGTVSAAATGTLANTATVTAGGGTTEINAGNNSATDTDTLTPQGDLSITKTDGIVNVVPGANNTYTIVVSNNGPSNVVGATVADTFPAGFSNVTFTASGTAGTSFSASGSGNLNDTVNIPAGGSITYTVTGKLSSGLTGTFTNTATISAPGGFTDPTPGNNSATDTDTLTPQADLQVIKTDSPDPVVAGTNLTYTITLNNLGLSDAANITLTDILPAGTTFVSLSTPGGYSATTPAVGSSGSVIITGASVAAGSTSVFTLVVSTASSIANGTVLSNTASVSTVTFDTGESNNTATATTTVTTSADLAINKTDSPDPVFVGNNLTYTITLNNLGSSDAQGVSITDVIPAGLTFVSASVPAGWSASTPAVGTNGTVTFTKTSVAAGSNDSFTIVVTATAAVGGTGVSNTATVTSSTTDPVAGNNSATAETFVGGIDLAVNKSDSVTSTIPGATLTYVINYANNGYVTATGVVLTETLPVGTTFNAADNPGWTSIGSNQYTYTVGSLAAGGTGSANFVVRVQNVIAAGLGQTANTITITDDATHGGDINAADNSATDIDTLNAAPNLQVTITDSPAVALRGGMVSYALNYSNIGNQDATGAFLTITLPANTFFNPGASTAGWFLDSGSTYKLAVGNLAGGGAGTGTATFAVQVANVLPGGYNVLSTTGTVDDDHTNGADPNTANNTETELTPIYQGIYVVAPGVALPKKGAPPVLRVFDIASGTEMQIQAYEASYRNSIRVATGDINGDGYDDIITTTITGNGRVRVFDGVTGQQFTGAFAEIAAFPEKGARGAYVASGDVNGDGRDDIIVGSGYAARGTAKVRIIDGVTGQITTTSEPFGTRFHGGVRVAVADVANFNSSEGGGDLQALVASSGDGREEIIVSQGYGGNQIKVLDHTLAVKNTITVGGSRYRGGVFVAAADLTGDGIAELIAGRDRGKTFIETFDAGTGALLNTITPFAANYKLGVRVAAADVNLDGVADIIAASGGRNGSLVKFFDGVTKTEITGKTFSAYPQYPTGALFVAGTSSVPSVNSWLPA